MKKILTLLFTAGIFTASYAQGNHDYKGQYDGRDQYPAASNDHYDNRYHQRDDPRFYDHRDHYYENQRRIQIERINREYSYKVMSIQRDWYMTRRQRKLAIREAENNRNYELQMLNRRFNGYANNGYGSYERHDDDRR